MKLLFIFAAVGTLSYLYFTFFTFKPQEGIFHFVRNFKNPIKAVINKSLIWLLPWQNMHEFEIQTSAIMPIEKAREKEKETKKGNFVISHEWNKVEQKDGNKSIGYAFVDRTVTVRGYYPQEPQGVLVIADTNEEEDGKDNSLSAIQGAIVLRVVFEITGVDEALELVKNRKNWMTLAKGKIAQDFGTVIRKNSMEKIRVMTLEDLITELKHDTVEEQPTGNNTAGTASKPIKTEQELCKFFNDTHFESGRLFRVTSLELVDIGPGPASTNIRKLKQEIASQVLENEKQDKQNVQTEKNATTARNIRTKDWEVDQKITREKVAIEVDLLNAVGENLKKANSGILENNTNAETIILDPSTFNNNKETIGSTIKNLGVTMDVLTKKGGKKTNNTKDDATEKADAEGGDNE